MFEIHYSNFYFHNIVETNKKRFPRGYREIYIHILLFGTDARTPMTFCEFWRGDGRLFIPSRIATNPLFRFPSCIKVLKLFPRLNPMLNVSFLIHVKLKYTHIYVGIYNVTAWFCVRVTSIPPSDIPRFETDVYMFI